LQWREASEWEERQVRDALLSERIDESVITSARHVVEILNADDLGDFLTLLELSGSHVAQTDVPNQSLALQFGKHSQWFLKGAFRRFQNRSDPQADDVEVLNAEIPKIVMNTVDQILARPSWNP